MGCAKAPALAVSLMAILLVSGCTSPAAGEGEACLKGKCFAVELADTTEERTLGLMHRKSLPADRGMLFVFDEEKVYPFWMKNTLIPLDIIWISAGKEVVFVSRDTPPCVSNPCPLVTPDAPAKYVLEVNAGIAESLGIEPGDVVSISLG
jgi:uncharacterized membrane protein (UPF0127 family)